MLTDGHGVPLGVVVAGAKRPDMKLVAPTLYSLVVEWPAPTEEQPQGICLDKGDDYKDVRETLVAFGFTAHIGARGEEAQALKRKAGFRARRWVVKRTHSEGNRFRRLLIRWDKKADNYLPCFTSPARSSLSELQGYSDSHLEIPSESCLLSKPLRKVRPWAR